MLGGSAEGVNRRMTESGPHSPLCGSGKRAGSFKRKRAKLARGFFILRSSAIFCMDSHCPAQRTVQTTQDHKKRPPWLWRPCVKLWGWKWL